MSAAVLSIFVVVLFLVGMMVYCDLKFRRPAAGVRHVDCRHCYMWLKTDDMNNPCNPYFCHPDQECEKYPESF